jgi:hypothetical protein
MADALDRNTVISMLANAIGAVAQGHDDVARTIIADLHGGYAKERQQSLPGLPSPSPRVDHYNAAVERIFAYWQAKCDRAQSRLTTERRARVLARLRENRSESEIKCAIDGAAAAAYTDSSTGKTYNDLELICRSGTKLEDFIDRGLRAGSTHTVGLLDQSGAPVSSVSVDLEQQIAQLRHNMSLLRKDGRDNEYEAAGKELEKLLAARRKKS